MTKSNYPRCKTCKFRNEDWECDNAHINDYTNWSDATEIHDMLVYSYREGGSFFVGEDFGCVHHEEK
jgi:hypothetical protein